MKHFLSTVDWSRDELDALLEVAAGLKKQPIQDRLKGKSIALMFLNPSMRTRTSQPRSPASTRVATSSPARPR